jgi:hypothetical protein
MAVEKIAREAKTIGDIGWRWKSRNARGRHPD